MLIINFIIFISLLFKLVIGTHDSVMFLIANDMGQLILESPTQSRVLADGLVITSAFDYSFNENLIFYAGDNQQQQADFISVIKVINLTNFQTHDVYKLEHGVISTLALDWHNMMVYWADFKEEYIAVGEMNLELMSVTKQKILISSNLSTLKSICVDPVTRSLYWLRSGESTQIESAGLDGSQRTVIYDESGVKGRDLKLDYSTNRILWFDETHNRIECINLQGSDLIHIPVPGSKNDRPQFLTAFDGRAYFFSGMSIISVSEMDTIILTTHVHMTFNYKPYAVKVFSASEPAKITTKGNFTCVPERFKRLTNTGETGCNFLCLSSPSKPLYTCACPSGISSSKAVASPNRMKGGSQINLAHSFICPKNPEKFLLVARPPTIFMLSLDNQLVDSPLWPIGMSPNPRGTLIRVDFDPRSEFIYWVDNAIYRLKLGERNPTAVIEPANGALQTLDGLAVDWMVGNLYWSTGGNRQIWVSRLDGAWPRLLLTLEDFDDEDGVGVANKSSVLSDSYWEETTKRRPTALVIDPINRYLFFNVWSGTRGRIERTWLDGTHREVIVDHNHTVWPNGIALDFEARHLYYVDAYLGVISRVDYNGGNPKRIVSGHLQHPFGFDLLGDSLYWSDWQTLSISQINKHTGEDLRVLKTISVDEALMGIRAVDLGAKSMFKGNVCDDKSKSGCSHLCFTLPAHHSGGSNRSISNKELDALHYCACPPEYALDSDGMTCIVPDSMLLYYLDGTGIRRMSLPKSRLRPHQAPSRTPLKHPSRNDRQSSITTDARGGSVTYHDVELAAAEAAVMASNQIFNQVPLPFLHRVIRFDVHISEERIYWVEDFSPQCISVAFLNGTGKETLLCLFHNTGPEETTENDGIGNESPASSTASERNHQARESIVGLALDWLTNALYFCVDGEHPRLEVIDLKYRNYMQSSSLPFNSASPSRLPPRKTLRRGNWHSKRLRRSVVPPWFLQSSKSPDPSAGDYDIYSYDFNPVTDRLANNVDNYRLVLLHNLSSPRDIVVHPKKRYLFWLDGTHNSRFNIFSAGLDGRNRRVIWNGVGMVMSLAIDYTTDRLYWMNWVTKCIESISLNGEDWFSVNPLLPSDHASSPNADKAYDNSGPPPSASPTDFHPYAIDVFQGAVLFSELTTQSVYRVQIPNSRSVFTTGSQLNLPADLLLRGPSSPSGRQNFLVLGLFVAGFDRQAAEPSHRCAPLASAATFYPQSPAWGYPYSPLNLPSQPQHQQTGPICQALCLGAPPPQSLLGGRIGSSSSSSSAQPSVFRGRGVAGGYPLSLLDDRSPRFTCACPTQFTLASDGYSCLEPHRSLLMITTDGSIMRYTPDDQPVTNLLSLSPLTLPTHDQLSSDGLNPLPTWHPIDQLSPYAMEATLNRIDPDSPSDPLIFARRWSASHRVAATALEELTNAGLFFLLQPIGKRNHTPPVPTSSRSRGFRQGLETGSNSRNQQHNSFASGIRSGTAFVRLGFLEFATGEVTLWEGGPLVSMPDNASHSYGSSGDLNANVQQSHFTWFNRPRWSLAFDPVNQIVFWSDALTGLIGAENSRSGRTIGLVANLTENSRTVLEIVVEPRSGQLFQLTSKRLEADSQPTDCRIEVTYLDGSDRRLLFDSTKYSVCPHSLTYSAKLAQLFWVDPGKRRICTLNVASGIGSGNVKPETIVVNTSPIPKSLVILPESTRVSPSSGSSLWLTWMEPNRHSVNSGNQNHSVSLLCVPIDSSYANGAPAALQKPLAPHPELDSYIWNSGNQLFLVPVCGGGLGDLSWHPCAGPSHGECSQFCLPKATASSPSLPLYPGPLTPDPPLSSPQPKSLWRTVRRCACALGSQLLSTGSQGDEGNACSRISYCLPPNILCRAGPTSRGKKTRAGNYFLVGEPFPQRGVCIPAHKACDGVSDCQDRSDEMNCPQICPEYECDSGLCLPFSSRCNDVIECDSDESCCGKDQFECRRPHHSFLMYQHYSGAPSTRCLPSTLVCNGRPDCSDGWDEASCEDQEPRADIDVKNGNSTNGSAATAELTFADGASKGSGEFPYVYTVFIVSAVIVVLVIFSLIAYLCSKKRSKSSYTVRTNVLLIPTSKGGRTKGGGEEGSKVAADSQMKNRSDCQEPLVAGRTRIKSIATVTEHVSTDASRYRRSAAGSRKITSKVTVLPPPLTKGSSNWYCPSCSSRGGQSSSVNASKVFCNRCQKCSYHHLRNLKSSRTRSPCHCGAIGSDVEDPDNSSSAVYWTRGPSKCPPAPPPSSLPSPPPSPTASCLFEAPSTCPPPAPPPSKLRVGGEEDEEDVGGSSSSEFSESSSLTTSPLRCRHFHHRQPRRYHTRRHRHSQRHKASASSTVSMEHNRHYHHASGRRRRGSSRGLRHRKVSFRSDLDDAVDPGCTHCAQCGSRQQKQPSSHKNVMRRNTFTTATTAVQQHTLVTTYNRVEPSLIAPNTIESSTSSSGGRKTTSNHSSEFYPRETVNPPPSPITESTYASLPLAVLKHPELILGNSNLSHSSGSNGIVCNEGVNSFSFEALGNDNEFDKRIIATVGNLGRSNADRSVLPPYYPPGDGALNLSKQLFSSASKYSPPLGSGLHSHCRHRHRDGELSAAVTSASTAGAKTTTTTIQNVHVVIVTSNKEQLRQCCNCCSDCSLSSSESECEQEPSTMASSHQINSTSPSRCLMMPDEPREQAEGAEAEDVNHPTKAPFAQFSSSPSSSSKNG